MQLISLNTASIQPLRLLDGSEVASAYAKQPRKEAVAVSFEGLAGDQQADRSVHGGPQRALYAYPSEHYPVWRTLRAQAKAADWQAPLPWGSLGENLTLAGLSEREVWIGDRLVFPECTLQITQPRQPCSKLNAALGFAQAARMMVQSGYSGFYLAVVRPGPLAAGQIFTWEAGPRALRLSEWRDAGP